MVARGDPNLCPHIVFCGLFPHPGGGASFGCMSRRQPVSRFHSGMDATTAMMLEPLGVAIHSLDLAKVRLGESVAVIGAGPIGLCLLRLAAAAGAGPIFAADRLPWRLRLAGQFGPSTASCTRDDELRPDGPRRHPRPRCGRGV